MTHKQFGSDISWSRVFVMTLFITLAISISPTIAQQKLKKPKAKSLKMKWMDTIQIRDKKTEKKIRLTVYQMNPLHEPLTPQQQQQLEKSRSEGVLGLAEETFSYKTGNCAFIVVRSQDINKEKTPRQQVVGLVYVSLYALRIDDPDEQLSSKLVWNRAKETVYLVVAMDTAKTTIAIAPIDPQKNLGTFPLEFPPLKEEKWIKPVKLLAELNTEIGPFYMSGIDVISDQDTILIAVHDAANDKAEYLRYDLTKDQWKKVEVPEGTLIKTKSKKKIKK